ncbi:MAG: phosphate acetyltransferase [Spirochaetales bacterium]|nr:phosphate acetyltransferase [Spirochaetales bacterium]
MATKIFIASTERGSGKSLVTIGLMSAVQGFVPRVGYMKPVGQRYESVHGEEEDATLVKALFDLKDDPRDITPMSLTQAQQDKDALFEKIFKSFKSVSKDKDAIFIEGTDYTSTMSALEFDINAELAQNLVAPVLLVALGHEKSIDDIVHNVTEYAESFTDHGCTLLGAIVNRFDSPDPRKDALRLKDRLEKNGIPLFGVILNNPVLSGPRLSEVRDAIGAEIMIKGDDLDRVVTDTKILAMTPENALEYIHDQDGYLLITSGDRAEHIFTILSAHKSVYYPDYAGIILTGGLTPGNNVRTLLEGISDAGLTILSVKDDTFTTALNVSEVRGKLSKDDPEKIELAKHSIQRYVDIRRIYDLLGTVQSDMLTPRMFQYRILEKAKAMRKKIVLPEGTEPRILKAAEEIIHRDVCDVVVLGDKKTIIDITHREGVSLDELVIHDYLAEDRDHIEEYGRILYELRKHKGVTLERARDAVLDPIVYAALMVYKGDADGYVSGATHSTADTLRPVLQLIKTKPEVSLASSVFFMCMPEQVLVYGDCALVAKPTAEELADIAITSADTASFFGLNPVVAMLSYSTGESGFGEDVDKVRKAATLAKERRPDLLIEGPIQYDAATSQEVANIKFKDSKVAGKATVYIFPDLDAGNTAYKAVQRSANVPAIGPVLQGLNKPANDLSRGATVTDIVYTIAITAIQAQQK